MADIRKHVVSWTGFQGAPGYSVFYGADTDGLKADLKTFFEAVKSYIPTIVTLTFESGGDVLSDVTGALVGTYAEAAPAAVDCSAAGAYSAPAGAYVRWNTNTIVAGRRLRGRTFLVPLANLAYQSDGTLDPAVVTAIQAAASTLALDIDARLRVWHRPVAGAGGLSAPVNGATVPDVAAVLRSRRD